VEGQAEVQVVSQPEATVPAGAKARARPLRADARRNRQSLLTAAAAAFSEQGVEVSIEEVARRAGVGIGTLYRHFPTRDALVEAVYRQGVENLCGCADELLRDRPPDAALAAWMQEFVRYVATKRGLAAHLKGMVGKDSELFTYTHRLIDTAIEHLLSAAVEAGSVRDDVAAADLLRGMSGICVTVNPGDLNDQAARLTALLMDGLRYGARNPSR
jgi:AcrR family transcriptional regulator